MKLIRYQLWCGVCDRYFVCCRVTDVRRTDVRSRSDLTRHFLFLQASAVRPSAAVVGHPMIWPLRGRKPFYSLADHSSLFILAFKLDFIQFCLNPLYQHLMNASPPTLLCGFPLCTSILFFFMSYTYSFPLILHSNVRFSFPFFFSSLLLLNAWMELKCQESPEKYHVPKENMVFYV